MSSSEYIVEAKNLVKSYGKEEVLKGINLNVKKGTMVALLGPNGAGKTTTVRILSTLLSFNSGTVTIGGFDVVSDADEVRNIIGLTGQSAAVDELLTGRENLDMMGQLYRLTPVSSRARAQELLEEFDLVKAADRTVKTYSGGMRRRLDLAVSLIAEPPVIFLDEPTTGLDPRSRLAMWDIIKKLLSNGTTILLTTQYLEEADQLADRIMVIDEGEVIAGGTSDQLKSKIGNDRLALSFENEQILSEATKLLGNKVVDINNKENSLTLFIYDTDKDMRMALDKLADEKIHVKSIDIYKPTLDDVFLSLTGKQKEVKKEKKK